MNQLPYIVVDELGLVAAATGVAMDLTINYQYGYVRELNETLIAFSKTPTFEVLKFPLIWVAQPFTIQRGKLGWYGTVKGGRIFFIQQSTKTKKAKDRMTDVFKPLLYPMVDEFLRQLKRSPAFSIGELATLEYKMTDRYYWGEGQQSVLNDVIDCIEFSDFTNLLVNNNPNCLIPGIN